MCILHTDATSLTGSHRHDNAPDYPPAGARCVSFCAFVPAAASVLCAFVPADVSVFVLLYCQPSSRRHTLAPSRRHDGFLSFFFGNYLRTLLTSIHFRVFIVFEGLLNVWKHNICIRIYVNVLFSSFSCMRLFTPRDRYLKRNVVCPLADDMHSFMQHE
jgi:hypothetical protein